MITQIVVHILPHEIDWFDWQSKQFKQGSYYIKDNIIIDVTLNLNLIDWAQSQLPKQFFIDKFNQIKTLWDWAETNFIVDDTNTCLGCDDKRRDSIRSTTADNILYLDSDLIFSSELLGYAIEAAKLIDHDYYIISPQTYKLWDSSWDCLVNEQYKHLTPSQDYKDIDPYQLISNTNEISVTPIDQFKFGGGWFNLISTKLLKLTDIPDSFGPYGIDDTYVMICCDIMKQMGYHVQQYVLNGTIVAENLKYRWNLYNNYLFLINRQDEFRNQAENNLNNEIQLFKNRI